MSRTVAMACIVLQLIAKYPCIIAVRGDNFNVGTYQTLPPLVMKGLVQEYRKEEITVMALMLVACITSEGIPLFPHINDSTPSPGVVITNKSTVNIVSQAIPIPFCSTNLFQYQDAEEGSGDLRPHCVNLYGNSLEPMKLQST